MNGNLALSRAIGDFEFKQNSSLSAEKQIVTADPEIISHEVTGEEEFLVLGCVLNLRTFRRVRAR